MEQRLYGIRGATGCINTVDDIEAQVRALYDGLLSLNKLPESDIVSILFTMTADLTACNPAAALRKQGRAQQCALFVCQEPHIDGALPGIIRILIHGYLPVGSNVQHLYRNGAEALRPDWAGTSGREGIFFINSDGKDP